MRTLFRLVKKSRAKEAFDGEGARLAGGRWNLPGTRAVYLSSSLSRAALELFVHLPTAARKLELVYFEVEIPDGVRIDALDAARLPKIWRAQPAPEEAQRLGTAWLKGEGALLLAVPSVIVPRERNVLMNPAHVDARALKIGKPQPFSFDPRMWK